MSIQIWHSRNRLTPWRLHAYQSILFRGFNGSPTNRQGGLADLGVIAECSIQSDLIKAQIVHWPVLTGREVNSAQAGFKVSEAALGVHYMLSSACIAVRLPWTSRGKIRISPPAVFLHSGIHWTPLVLSRYAWFGAEIQGRRTNAAAALYESHRWRRSS